MTLLPTFVDENVGDNTNEGDDYGTLWTEYPTGTLGVDTVGYLMNGVFLTNDIGYVVGGPKFGAATNGGIAKTLDGG